MCDIVESYDLPRGEEAVFLRPKGVFVLKDYESQDQPQTSQILKDFGGCQAAREVGCASLKDYKCDRDL